MRRKWAGNRGRDRWFVSLVAAAGLLFSTLGVSASAATATQEGAVQESSVGNPGFADVVARVGPAVVNITVTKTVTAEPTALSSDPRGPGAGSSPFDDFFGRFFGSPQNPSQGPRKSEGQGSGFLIDPSGYIVTNNHVAGDADTIVVTLQDGRKLDAKLIGHDPKTDLALIKVDGTNLPAVQFGDSDAARVGDWVVAIGNPFGLGGTATAGIISARGRDIQSGPYDDYLQLDAPINFGNSGGPVFNAQGQVIGVNTAIYSPNGGNVGIGFAIPSNQASRVVASLRDSGTVRRGWLGVEIQSLDDELAASLGLKDAKGALVADVVANGPAAAAGVATGDVITRFNGEAIDTAHELSRAVGNAAPLNQATLTVWRDGKTRQLSVKLGEPPQAEAVAATSPSGKAQSAPALGLSLRPLTDEDRATLGLDKSVEGALVAAVAPDSPAADKNLQPGDVITRVNQKTVANANDAIAALNAAKSANSPALLLVRRGDAQEFVALKFS
jgi:serine protease Do